MRVAREFVFAAVSGQRRQLADLLCDLDEAQLKTPSLCMGWDVKTVAAHIVSTVTDGTPAFLRLAARRGSMARAIDELAHRRAQQPIAQIIDDLYRCADHPLSPPLFGPLDPLADVLVHSGDIRIPLGLPFDPEPQLASLALDFLAGPWAFGFVPLGRLRGIRLCANDVDRCWRQGVDLCGSAAALMISVAGRTALLGQLNGEGLPLLSQRLGE